jgi:hypothetical protein
MDSSQEKKIPTSGSYTIEHVIINGLKVTRGELDLFYDNGQLLHAITKGTFEVTDSSRFLVFKNLTRV